MIKMTGWDDGLRLGVDVDFRKQKSVGMKLHEACHEREAAQPGFG